MLLITTSASSQILGLHGQNGQFKFKFSDNNLTVQVDGITLIPAENRTSFMEFPHGPHLIQVYNLKKNKIEQLLFETMLFIPGGYLVEATYTKMGLTISKSAPIIGSPIQTSGTTTSSVGMTNETSSTSTSSPQKPGKKHRLSRLLFTSKEGMCEVYLDGVLKAELDIPDTDGMAHASIQDVEPNAYLIKVKSISTVWYDGKITVNSCEEIKIRIEPGKFKIISRNPIN